MRFTWLRLNDWAVPELRGGTILSVDLLSMTAADVGDWNVKR